MAKKQRTAKQKTPVNRKKNLSAGSPASNPVEELHLAMTPKRKKKRGKRKPKLTEQEREQRAQMKEIRSLMANMGFTRMPNVDGKQFTYDGRMSELDDIFFYENIVVLSEYTVTSSSSHLLTKKIIYDKINQDPAEFLKFLTTQDSFKAVKDIIQDSILSKYTHKQIQLRIVYASRNKIAQEQKDLVDNIKYFDYSIVKYFESIAKVIKRSCKYEFFNFLDIPFNKVGSAVKASAKMSTEEFSGHILPEEHSSFQDGYKLVSFYIDAKSLLKRAYVLRRDGWRNTENVGLYQRMLLGKKIRSMRKYLHEEKRVFINNIIVTLPVEKIKLYSESGEEMPLDRKGQFKYLSSTNATPATIKIDDISNIIGIIDGQHRAYSYHEADDAYEETIAKLRDIQNLLVTGILFPKDEPEEKRLNFEAKLFLEINANQSGAPSQLKQEIESMRNPFSTISISKHIINKLNESGPLATLFEEYWFEQSKLKTASVISFGLKPLVKFEGVDTLFNVWKNTRKHELNKGTEDYDLLKEYKAFCTEQVRNIFIGLKANVTPDNWKVDRNDPSAILTVTTINGIINCLRLLVEADKCGEMNYYRKAFSKIGNFDFKKYKSSQYRQMGQDIYKLCFAD